MYTRNITALVTTENTHFWELRAIVGTPFSECYSKAVLLLSLDTPKGQGSRQMSALFAIIGLSLLPTPSAIGKQAFSTWHSWFSCGDWIDMRNSEAEMML